MSRYQIYLHRVLHKLGWLQIDGPGRASHYLKDGVDYTRFTCRCGEVLDEFVTPNWLLSEERNPSQVRDCVIVPPVTSVASSDAVPSKMLMAPMSKDQLLESLREIAQKHPDYLLLVGYAGDDGDIHMLTEADLK
jgi:hypothetical protein